MSSVLVALKASVCITSHMKSFEVFRSGRRGDVSSASRVVRSPHWFTRPMNDRRSVRVAGIGKSWIAAILSSSTVKPSVVTWNPQKSTSRTPNSNFFGLNVMPCSRAHVKTWRTCWTWLSKSASYARQSSTILAKLGTRSNARSVRRLNSSPAEIRPWGFRR